MEKNVLGSKIKSLRNGKGYSQEHLSDLAQLSLRTVQRIENGETEARGDTLNRLAKALEVSIDELIGVKTITGNNNSYLALINLSTLATLFVQFPFFGIILPLILWQVKKDSITDINEQVKKIINFQITWILFCFTLFMLFILNLAFFQIHIPIGIDSLATPDVMLIVPGIVFLTNALQVIINAVRIRLGKEIKYWPVIRFIR